MVVVVVVVVVDFIVVVRLVVGFIVVFSTFVFDVDPVLRIRVRLENNVISYHSTFIIHRILKRSLVNFSKIN